MATGSTGVEPSTGRDPQGSPGERLAGLTDEECALLARAGSRSAQEELVERYLSRIYAFFARSLGDRGLAADGTQEVFLKLFREIASFDPARSFRAWIHTIAWNQLRDILRRRAARREAEAGASGLRRGLPREEDSPEEMAAGKERAEAVRAALERLEPRQRALLALREFEGLSYEEIAELAGCRVGTIKSGIHRARLDLKRAVLEIHPRWSHGL